MLTKMVQRLDGAPIKRTAPADSWAEFFEGFISINNAHKEGELLVFELIVPTSKYDRNDYIWRSERETGTTKKVVFVQNEIEIESARVIAIAREGQDASYDASGPEQYRFTVSIPISALSDDVLVQVQFRWKNSVLAFAG